MAFATYGVCEALLGVVLPGACALLEESTYSIDPWIGTGFLIAYPLTGAALGAVHGALLVALGGRWLRPGSGTAPQLLLTAASAFVVLAVLGNVAARDYLGLSGAAVLVVLASLLAVGVASAHPGRRGWSILGHPFLAVPLVTALLWATRIWLPDASLISRLAVSLGFVSVALAMAMAMRLRSRAPAGGGLVLAVISGALALGLHTVDHDPPPVLATLAGMRLPADSTHPPVVIVVLDTVRADHLSTYGYPRETDRNLARFASRAWVFERAVMPGDMTLSSHASLFTGQWVSHHGTHAGHPILPKEATTLAELLRDAGYTTIGVVANCSWIGPDHGVDQGFQFWDARCARAPFRGIGKIFLRSSLQEVIRRGFFREHASWAWRSAGQITDEALGLIDSLAVDGAPPFLLFLNYMDVHRPIHPPARYRDRFPGRMPSFDMQDDWSALHRDVSAGRREVTPDERDHLVSQYDGALAYLDAQLGRVLAHLDEKGLLEPSLVIVTSDHGESFGSHGTFGHGRSVYQAVVGVPLVVKLPGRRDARRIPGSVSGVDVLPTVTEIIGLPVPADIDGHSLLSNPPDAQRPLLSESFGDDGLDAQARAVLRGDEKLVEPIDRPPQFYRLDADPREEYDLAGSVPELVAELTAVMDALDSEDLSPEPLPPARLTPKEAERLRSLGYLDEP
ncbi:MAG: sulfatase-like hydrolase/transferase [Methylococcales bacterium]